MSLVEVKVSRLNIQVRLALDGPTFYADFAVSLFWAFLYLLFFFYFEMLLFFMSFMLCSFRGLFDIFIYLCICFVKLHS